MTVALLLLGGYLVGSIPFGVIVSRAWKGVDIRKYGSGNIGFANALRVLGPGPAAVVLAGDALKGYLPTAAACYLFGRSLPSAIPGADLWLLAVALAPILGHSFSVFLKFRGGRAVATTAGVLLAMCWPAALVGLGVWLIVVALTRYISLGSMLAACSVPIYMLVTGQRWEWLAFWCAIAALVVIRHTPNIRRLLSGTETKIGHTVERHGRR